MDLATAIFPENQRGGFLICGINWGGSPSKEDQAEIPSFFSDSNINNYPFRNRIRRWFELWGHPLETCRGREGAFERSIAHMNWLSDQSRSMRKRDAKNECVVQRDRFFSYAEELNPRVIMFCGITLLDALNDISCIQEAEKLFGQSTRPRYMKKEVSNHGQKLRKFRVGFQTFERSEIIALPHPTGSIGLSDDYVEAYRSEIEPILNTYRLNFSIP